MRFRNSKLPVLLAVLAAATSAGAISANLETFRTLALLRGVAQGQDSVTGAPQLDAVTLRGFQLVNLAMGRPVGDASHPEQVLAMTIACDLGDAELVVYDRAASRDVATIAESTSVDSVRDQGPRVAAPNRAVFVARFDVDENGNATDGIASGFATVAGRLHLDPQTGCPHAVLVSLDKDPNDKLFGDADLSSKDDPEEGKDVLRAGHAHLIGVLDLVSAGKSATVLVPFGKLSIRRPLPDASAS
jgi:hypothetical protein